MTTEQTKTEPITRPFEVRSDDLLAAAVAVRDYLESIEAICCADFDIPDAIWVPFTDAIKAKEQAANVGVDRPTMAGKKAGQ